MITRMAASPSNGACKRNALRAEDQYMGFISSVQTYHRHPMVSVRTPPTGPPMLRPRVMDTFTKDRHFATSRLATMSARVSRYRSNGAGEPTGDDDGAHGHHPSTPNTTESTAQDDNPHICCQSTAGSMSFRMDT